MAAEQLPGLRMCQYPGCCEPAWAQRAQGKWCEAHKNVRHNLKRDAARRGAIKLLVTRMCQYGGCTEACQSQYTNSRWCSAHIRLESSMRHNARRKERYAMRAPKLPRTPVVRAAEQANPAARARRPGSHSCQHCYDMPWARTLRRRNEWAGSGGYPDVPVCFPAGLGVPGHHRLVCRGCGEEEAEEERPEQIVMGSSAGYAVRMANEYGTSPSLVQVKGSRK